MKVLIADDDRVLVHLLTNRLRANGCEIATAFDAMQAFVSAMRCTPDVILLDIQMPLGTGIDVLKKLKLSARTSQIPVIVLSGSMEPVAAEALVRGHGAAAFMAKPIIPEAVYTAMVVAIESRHSAVLRDKLARYTRMSAPRANSGSGHAFERRSIGTTRTRLPSITPTSPSALQARNLP